MRSARQIEHDKMIDGLDINGVLDRYFGKADTFVLISSFRRNDYDNLPFNLKYPFGRVRLQKSSDVENALVIAEMRTKKYLIRAYERLLDEQRAELPPFETVCEEIKAECMEFNEKRKRGEFLWTEALCKEYGLDDDELDEYCHGKSLSISDLYRKDKTKYTNDNIFIEHCYFRFGDIYANDDCNFEMLQAFMKNTYTRPLNYELRKPPYSELLTHLIKVTPTFAWHCTYTRGLVKEFRFRFNEDTRAWLAEHYKFESLIKNYSYMRENECDKYGLDDLAFYYGDKLLFSQCSHERQQYDYLERFDD